MKILFIVGVLSLNMFSAYGAELTGITEVSETSGNLTGAEYDFYSLSFVDQCGARYAVTMDNGGDLSSVESIPENRMILNNRKVTLNGEVSLVNGQKVIAFQSAILIDEPSLAGTLHTHFMGSPTISLADGRIIRLATGKVGNLSSLNKKTCLIRGQFAFDGDSYYSVDSVNCSK